MAVWQIDWIRQQVLRLRVMLIISACKHRGIAATNGCPTILPLGFHLRLWTL